VEEDLLTKSALGSTSRTFTQILLLALLSTFDVENRGKGRLLLEEGEEEFKRHSAKMSRRFKILEIAAIAYLVAISAVFYVLDGPTTLFWILVGLVIFLLAVSIPSLLLGVKPYQSQQLRVYENGFEFPAGSRSVFYSFGEITKMKEVTAFIGDKHYWFSTDEEWPASYYKVRQTIEGLDELMDDIREKIGRPEYLIRAPPTDKELALSKRYEENAYLAGFLVGLIPTIILLAAVYFGLLGFDYLLIDLILIIPFFTMILLVFVTSEMMRTKLAPPKPNVKIPGFMIVGLLLLVMIFVAVGDGYFDGAIRTEENTETVPGTSVLAPGSYDRVNLDIAGSVVVKSGEILHVKDSTILFNGTSDTLHGIFVEKGGFLFLEDCWISTYSSSSLFRFEIKGSATILEGGIQGLWGDSSNKDGDGGLEIYSSDVVIDGTSIYGGRTNGILVVNANPTIANTTIMYVGDEAIELRNSDAKILNNTIQRNERAISVSVNSDPVIKGNDIRRNGGGIEVELSSGPVIDENVFYYNRYALKIHDDCNPRLGDNVFLDNGQNKEREGTLYAGTLCVSWTGVVAVICLLALPWLYWKGARKEVELMGPKSPAAKKFKI
jgi:parallel beta-helix repeat protein